MKLTRYLYVKRFPDGSAGAYGTRTGGCLRLEREWADLLDSGETSSFPPELTMELTRAGLLAEDGEDELAQVLGMRRRDPAVFRILTTTACNAACAYCYEKGLPIRTMEPSVAEETAAFLARRLEDAGASALRLEWFGGEPLLNEGAIDRICVRLRERDIRFFSTLTTNGALLPREPGRLLRDWSLTGVQIGLDGAGRDHERFKGLPEGSFSRIIDRVHRLLEAGCRVRIRIVHTGDLRRESALISFLGKEFPADKPEVYLFPRYEVGDGGLRGAMEEILTLERQLAEAGLLRPERMYRFRQRRGRCFAADGGLTIAPDGRLYSCSHGMRDRYCVGTVQDFREDNEEYRGFTASDLPPRCLACVFLPFCMGGCRAAERRMADMFQCHPYSAVMDWILQIKCGRDNSGPPATDARRQAGF